METTGVWGPSARKFIQGLVGKQAMRQGAPVHAAAAAIWRRLTTAVLKGTAQMLTRAFPADLTPDTGPALSSAQASGPLFADGSGDVPATSDECDTEENDDSGC